MQAKDTTKKVFILSYCKYFCRMINWQVALVNDCFTQVFSIQYRVYQITFAHNCASKVCQFPSLLIITTELLTNELTSTLRRLQFSQKLNRHVRLYLQAKYKLNNTMLPSSRNIMYCTYTGYMRYKCKRKYEEGLFLITNEALITIIDTYTQQYFLLE